MQATFDGFEGDDYERRKERSRQREADMSRKGRDVGPLPPVSSEHQALVEACRFDLKLFLETFLAAIFCLEWSADHLKAIKALEDVILRGGQFAFAMPRGNGKTSLVIGAVIWAVCYGHRRFIVAIAATGPKAKEMLESIKTIFETNELLGQCFPAACFPVRALEGINNRATGQTLNGERTRIKWTGERLIFPTIAKAPSSGVIVHTAGLLGSVRGLQQVNPETGETLRPDAALLDDPQTDDSAKQPSQTSKRLRVINKAVLGLAGPTKKIAVICPCTVILPDDLADQLLDREQSPEWRGHRTKLLSMMPSDGAMRLWEQYREIRKDSLREHEDIRDATAYYREHLDAMQEGAASAWPERFEDEHVDAIQYAMDKWAKNEESFFAEYQNDPRPDEQEGIETLRSAELLERCNGLQKNEVPDWVTCITAFADIQQDILPWMVVGWGENLRGQILDYGAWPEQRKRYYTLRDVGPTLRESTQQPTVESGIAAGLEQLSVYLGDKWGQRLRWFGVDANWEITKEIVYSAARRHGVLMPFHGRFVGAASMPLAMWRKKAGERKGHFWRTSLDSRVRTVDADINSWKTLVLNRLRDPVDSGRGITWYGSKPYEHELLCDQLAAEFAVRVTGRGRTVDEWKNRPGRDNHLWDCLVGCAVGASITGMGLAGQAERPERKRVRASERQRERRRQRRA